MIFTIDLPEMDQATMTIISQIIQPVATALAEAIAPALNDLRAQIAKKDEDLQQVNELRLRAERVLTTITAENEYYKGEILRLTSERDKAKADAAAWEGEIQNTDVEHKARVDELTHELQSAREDCKTFCARIDEQVKLMAKLDLRNRDLIQRAHDMVALVNGWRID
jgi:predicted  nucleic acid-binding Zn-ribbon protein